MNDPHKNVVTVQIAGEDYTLRADATEEYTRECAAYVDRTISEILRNGGFVQTHKAAILAALALTDQLFQARADLQATREELAAAADRLAEDVRARL